MVISQKYAAIAVEYTDKKRNAQGVVFNESYLEYYRTKLADLAKKRNIKEGDRLENRDWIEISMDIVHLMHGAAERVARQSRTFRKEVKPRDYILSALNYLIAVTESELGSPDISIDNLKPYFRDWTKAVVKAKPAADISLQETFEEQRGINAIELQEEIIQPLLDDISANKNVSENVGKLYAEYQALVRRQANHGFFWRIFHPAENTARTDLIKELEVTLKSTLPIWTLPSSRPQTPIRL
jgi:hypothetical protein